MKTKNLLLAMTALTALTLSGCSENEVTDINPDAKPAMTFDVYTGVQTKGKETTTEAIQAESAGFGVLAYKTTGEWGNEGTGTNATPDLMYNEQVYYDNNAWKYDNIKYWPDNANEKISFFAYAPYEDQTGGNKKTTLSLASATGEPKITFEVNTELTNMVDLVTDHDTKDQVFTSNSTTNGTVSFELKHVLTKVVLKAKTDTDLGSVTKVYITGVKVSPLTTVSDTDKKFYSKATYKFADNTWDYSTNATAYSADFELSGDNGVLNLTEANTWGYTTSSIDVNSSSEAVDLFKTGEALYFIPVNNTTGLGTAGDVSLKVSYDIVTKIDNENSTKSSTTDKVISLPQGSLKKGNFYTYTLVIGMNAIKLEGTVSTDWTTDSNTSDLSPDTANQE